MQDKEFDNLLKSKLGDLEAEPSPMVWDNIANGLQQKKRRITPYLSIAASLIILVSAGLLFFRKAENNFVKPAKPNRTIVKVSKPAPDNLANNSVTSIPNEVNILSHGGEPTKKHMVAATPSVIVVKQPSQKSIKGDNGPVLVDPMPINPGPMLAETEPVQNIPNMLVPDKETSFGITANNTTRVIEKTITTDETENAPAKKRGIHSLGGLINAIVAKVDKREDKLIEFSDSEDDDTQSNVTGVNLGLIRIKKQQ